MSDNNLAVVHQLSAGLIFGRNCVSSGPPLDIAAKGNAFGIALHPKGSFLYTANSSSNTISVFSIAADGALAFQSQENANLNDSVSLAIDLQGKFLYAANLNDATVAEYEIDQITGALTPIGSGKVDTENPANSNSAPVTIVTTVSPHS